MLSTQIKEKYIIGVDEVGYGGCAGPIVVGAVRATNDWCLPKLKDSKKLSKKQREAISANIYELLKQNQIEIILESASNIEIDKFGLAVCHKQCIVRAINKLYQPNDQVIIDGNLNPNLFIKHGLITDISCVKTIIKADNTIPVVSAASIIAKVYRDNLMQEYHQQFPYYGWDKNSGYLVKQHKEGIKQYGFSELHRKSYNIKL